MTYYADEFDVKGVSVLTGEELEEIKDTWRKFEFPHESGFGSNQGLTFDDAEDVIGGYRVEEVTEEEYGVLKKFLPNDYGYFPRPYVYYDKDGNVEEYYVDM